MRRALLFVLLLPLAAVLGCGGGDDEPDLPAASLERVTTSSTERTTTTAPLTPEQEVEAAYLRSWDVYARAALELDPTGLEEVYAHRALQIVLEDIERYRRDNTPVRFEVEHDYSIQVHDFERALVTDRYVNHSVLLDGDTGEPIEPDPNEVLTEIYAIARVDGTWKVVGIQRLQS